jgi:putative ATPase
LERLTPEELKLIVRRALPDVEIDDEALEFLVQAANGDARVALNTLEVAAQQSFARPGLTREHIENVLQSRLLYDRVGEEHYNTISAFIKSMRGSDPDAALYYLARMLEAGEDPLFIARRMVIFASEDIGNADSQALPLAISVFQACERIGLPECQINMAHGVTYLASAPKSNASYSALLKAQKDVKETLNEPIPLHIRNAPTKLMKEWGYGKNYQYPHNFAGHFVREEYLPEKLRGRRYYFPTEQGFEKKIQERLEKLREIASQSKTKNEKCPKGL